MSIITGKICPPYSTYSIANIPLAVNHGRMPYVDVWDGDEHAALFKDDRSTVPDHPEGLDAWMTVVTHSDEGSRTADIFTDVVYVSNPSQRVIIRFRGIVSGAHLEGPTCVQSSLDKSFSV